MSVVVLAIVRPSGVSTSGGAVCPVSAVIRVLLRVDGMLPARRSRRATPGVSE
jgi:hypothetical protein